MTGVEYCSPKCKMFKCGKNVLMLRRDKAWCKWTEEECEVSNCSYAICVRRRLLPRGICGETVKRKTSEKEPEEVLGPAVKLRGKALRKIGEKEVF